METTAMSPGREGAGRKRVDGKAKTQSSATTAARGGEAKLYRRTGEKSHSPVPQGVVKLPRTPPRPERGGGAAGRKRNEHEKHIIVCLNRAV